MDERKVKDTQKELNKLLLEKTKKTIEEMDNIIAQHLKIDLAGIKSDKEEINKNV
jgi:hypothetical protein